METGIKVIPHEIIGCDPDSSEKCQCQKRKSLILFTTFISLESPLRCGDCFRTIPLYNIPKTYDDEYYNILCWESDYQSCDQLQMNCSVGEHFATNQMSKIDSQLSKQGIKVCSEIAKLTKTPTFYYLYRSSGKSINSERKRTCPSCDSTWLLKEQIHSRFDFKCNKCKLLSNIAYDIRNNTA